MSKNDTSRHSTELTRTVTGLPPVRPAVPDFLPAGAVHTAIAASNLNVPHYLWILRRQWWKCLTFVAASVIAAAVISARMTPLYESTATVDIDRQMPVGIIGQESSRPGANDSDQFLATQVKVIQSDSVLRKVALRYKLLDPAGADAKSPFSGPTPREDAPIVLGDLRVTRPPNTYLIAITYRSPDARLAADVANAISNSYVDHMHDIQYRSSARVAAFMEHHLEEIKTKMDYSSAALARFERDLNIISPEEKTSILTARLVQLNAEHTAAEADRVRKEASYRAVTSGSLEAAQVSSQGEALKKLSERLDEVQQKFADVQEHYGPNHPEYKKAAAQVAEVQRLLQKSRTNIAQRVESEYTQALNREQLLTESVARTKKEFDQVNSKSFEYQALKREAEADRKLYEELIRKIKEAGINAGFQSSAIRIADEARPAFKPVHPNKPLYLSLAFLLSSMLSVIVVVAGDALSNSVRDPEHLAHSLNTEVIGTLPRAKMPKLRALTTEKTSANGRLSRRVQVDGDPNAYDSAVRSLRNSILLSNLDNNLRSVMVTSPAPSEGKSTIAYNLAVANAQQGYRTLLIDCDLRHPSVHHHAGILNKAGIPDVLRGEMTWRQAIVKGATTPLLDILPANSPSPGDAEHVGEALPEILAEARNAYDLIVVDSPPILGFPEPMQIAGAADGVLMVAHAGQTDRGALKSALATLERLQVKVLGIVLNGVCVDTTEGYQNYAQYGSYYKHYQARS